MCSATWRAKQPVDGAIEERSQVREGVGLDRLESRGGDLLDHPGIEVDPVGADALLAHEREERPAAAPQIADPRAAGEQIGEPLGLGADDRLVAAEARLEIQRVQVRRDLVAPAIGPGALEPGEAGLERRRWRVL